VKKEEHLFLGRELTKSSGYSEKTAQTIDAEVHRIITECYERAKKIILDNKDKLIAIAEALLEKEVLEGHEVTAIIRGEYKLAKNEKKKEDEEPDDLAQPESDGPEPDKPPKTILDDLPHKPRPQES